MTGTARPRPTNSPTSTSSTSSKSRPTCRSALDEDDEVYRTGARSCAPIIALIEDCKRAAAGAGRHDLDREIRAARRNAAPSTAGSSIDFSDPNALPRFIPATRRQAKSKDFAILNARYPRAGGLHRRPGRRAGRDHIATNMAGRGTDIQLGGNADMRIRQELGVHRDSSRRARAQGGRDPRRGRAPQGKGDRRRRPLRHRHRAAREPPHRQPAARPFRPPGRSRPLEVLPVAARRSDAHLRLRAHGRHAERLGLKEDEAIVHPWINKALEKAQQKVEARNFDIRKNILKFDNVMNDQRKVIFDQRVEWMKDRTSATIVADMRHTVSTTWSPSTCRRTPIPSSGMPRACAKEELKRVLGLDLPVDEWAKEEGIADEEIFARVERRADEHMAAEGRAMGPDVMRYVEKSILLQTLDHLWREHLVMLDHLRQVIGPARLRPARSAQRIQGRSLQPVRIGSSAMAGADGKPS
jgi:preprotein translocase subunit SecA